MRHLIRELRGHHTILLCSHILPEVEQVCDRVVIFHRGAIVAEDATEALRASGGDRVTVEAPSSDVETLTAALEELAALERSEALDDGWQRLVFVATGEDPRAEIFRRAAGAGAVLRELTLQRASLETVFQQLTADEAAPVAAPAHEEG